MSKRGLRISMVAVGIVSAVVVPGTAQAEECVGIPVGTPGATLDAGGQEIRIPALGGPAICVEASVGGIGMPSVSFAPSGNCDPCYSVVQRGSSGENGGYVALRWSVENEIEEIRVPLGGTSPTPERCLVSVGAPEARTDCEVRLSLDQAPGPICLTTPEWCLGEPLRLDQVLEALEDALCIKCP